MRSRGRSWRSDRGVSSLVGTYQANGRYVAVRVCQPVAHSIALVFVERQRVPGVVCESELVSQHADALRAIRAAQAVVLAHGGSLQSNAEALGGSPVGKKLGQMMFTEIGLQRFVHVPAGTREG